MAVTIHRTRGRMARPDDGVVACIAMVASSGRVASRLGESVAEGIRLPRGDRALRDPPASRARASVPARRAARPGPPLHSRFTAAPIMIDNYRYGSNYTTPKRHSPADATR